MNKRHPSRRALWSMHRFASVIVKGAGREGGVFRGRATVPPLPLPPLPPLLKLGTLSDDAALPLTLRESSGEAGETVSGRAMFGELVALPTPAAKATTGGGRDREPPLAGGCDGEPPTPDIAALWAHAAAPIATTADGRRLRSVLLRVRGCTDPLEESPERTGVDAV